MILALLLASQLASPDYGYDVTDWISVVECPESVCDLSPAIQRIQDDAFSRYGDVYGPNIRIPRGVFTLSSPTLIATITEMRGQGMGKTVVRTDTTAFRCLYRTEALTHGGKGGHCKIEGMSVVSTRTDHDVEHFGVECDASCDLEDIEILSFTVGVICDSDVNRPGVEQANCNSSRLDGLVIYWSDGPGVVFDGGDSSNALLVHNNITHNCEFPDAWLYYYGDGQTSCAGVVDSNYLGNTYVSGHFALNRRADKSEEFVHLAFEGRNARNAALGVYCENSEPGCGYADTMTAVVGGIGVWHGNGLRIEGPNMNRAHFVNALDPTNVTELRFGEAIGVGGYILTTKPVVGGRWFSVGYDPNREAYFTDVSFFRGSRGLYIGASHDSPFGLGGLSLQLEVDGGP